MTRTLPFALAFVSMAGVCLCRPILGGAPEDEPIPSVKAINEAIQLNIKRARAELGRDGPVPAKNEVVMTPGMKITATTPDGTITITAGKGLKRSYTWEGATRSVEMWPREERWYGSLGLYFPGPGDHWEEHKGITRGVVEEGQQHFKSVKEAESWIESAKNTVYIGGRPPMQYVYRNDGLVVGWGKTLERNQLMVDVWQFLIEGKKPTKLKGSQDDKIVVEEQVKEKEQRAKR